MATDGGCTKRCQTPRLQAVCLYPRGLSNERQRKYMSARVRKMTVQGKIKAHAHVLHSSLNDPRGANYLHLSVNQARHLNHQFQLVRRRRFSLVSGFL